MSLNITTADGAVTQITLDRNDRKITVIRYAQGASQVITSTCDLSRLFWLTKRLPD